MKKLFCFCCDKELQPINSFQPNGGVMCSSYGNYGSTAFDPNLSFGTAPTIELFFLICDDCLRTHVARCIIFVKKPGEKEKVRPASEFVS
ncbi:MAG: hypothetical protein ABI747_00505 [Candidatus Moraniibacteriota bacterium]